MAKKGMGTGLPALFLKRVWLGTDQITDADAYPFSLPYLHGEVELRFEKAITIIAGENGAGKSTILEGIAALAGYDEAVKPPSP
jgi:predicted ATPase